MSASSPLVSSNVHAADPVPSRRGATMRVHASRRFVCARVDRAGRCAASVSLPRRRSRERARGRRIPLPDDLDLRRAPRHARLPGRGAARLPEARRLRDAVPGRRHHRRLAAAPELVLAAGAQRRRAEAAAQGAQGHARDLHPGQPRRVRAPLPRPRRSAASRSPRTGSTSPPTAARLWITHGDLFDGVIQCAKWLAHVGDPLYELTLRLNATLQLAARAHGAAVLVALALPEAEGQARGQLRRRLRGGARARSAQARRRRRRLRPHPPRRAARDRRHRSTPTTATGSRA